MVKMETVTITRAVITCSDCQFSRASQVSAATMDGRMRGEGWSIDEDATLCPPCADKSRAIIRQVDGARLWSAYKSM